jgi:hypothetical protein
MGDLGGGSGRYSIASPLRIELIEGGEFEERHRLHLIRRAHCSQIGDVNFPKFDRAGRGERASLSFINKSRSPSG